MTIKLKGKMENFEEKKSAYMALVKDCAEPEKQAEAWDEMQNALVADRKSTRLNSSHH